MQFRPDGGDAGFDARRAAAAAASPFSVPSCSSLMLSFSLSLSLSLSPFAGSPSIYHFLFFFLSFLALVAPCVLQKRCPACFCDRDHFFLIKIFMHLLVWE
jgi:hypothetical protein